MNGMAGDSDLTSVLCLIAMKVLILCIDWPDDSECPPSADVEYNSDPDSCIHA